MLNGHCLRLVLAWRKNLRSLHGKHTDLFSLA